MASKLAVEQSEEFKLLEAYCSKRSRQRSRKQRSWQFGRTDQGFAPVRNQGPSPVLRYRANSPARSFFQVEGLVLPAGKVTKKLEDGPGEMPQFQGGILSQMEEEADLPPDDAQSGVADRLLQIADSAPIPKAEPTDKGPEDPDELVQKLAALIKTSGDTINKQIKKNNVLQQQLQTAFSYSLFESLISSLQSLVSSDQTSRAAASETRRERKKIAWAFEVTSRLSAVDGLQRRVLGFGAQYIHLHHSAWVQQHGGWEEVFDVDDDDVD